MDRLTYWNEEYGCWSYRCASGDAAIRLAAYEDTGLEPEAFKLVYEQCIEFEKNLESIGGLQYLNELAQAEKDGRLVVLPVSAGKDRLPCVLTDPDAIFLTREAAEAALEGGPNNDK